MLAEDKMTKQSQNIIDTKQLIQTTEELIELLKQENAYLQMFKIDAVRALQPKKQKLLKWFEDKRTIVDTDPNFVIDTASEEAYELYQKFNILKRVTEDNRISLTTAMDINMKSMEFLTRIVSNHALMEWCYDVSGKISHRNHGAAHISVNSI
jgi:flagellar biosynthesis/type III secretory pathway chaperone